MSDKRKEGEKNLTVSFKLPGQVYEEMRLRVSEGERSTFIRDAVLEKLSKTPRPDKILALEERLRKLEDSLSEVKKFLADLEMLTFEKGKVNPYTFCIDDLDRKIVNVLLQEKGATTPELAEKSGVDRWVVLARLKRLQKGSKKELGRSFIDFFGGEKYGKKRAWWVVDELLEPSGQ
ncbi:MAG TPA: AsnC family protein [Candidatus Bathyarchaeia archaeon]|nr:AsnC family protein [Candidatus Bathyarchaeia archaeon]